MYSGSVATWISGSTVTAGQKRGWMGQVWTAVNTTTQMPAGDSTDWSADINALLQGITFRFLPDNKQFMQTRIAGITFTITHTNRPPEVNVGGITLTRRIQQPYLITFASI
jgi:hypothetical protein